MQIKAGDRVKHVTSGKMGTSKGPIIHFNVWWIHVEWDDGGGAYVLERMLEVVNEDR